MMRFLRPEFLNLFFLLPLILFALFLGLKSKYRIRRRWEESKLKDFSRFLSKAREIVIYCLIVLLISLSIFALSRPQISYKKPIEIKKPLDILGLVDSSWSGNTQDVLYQGKKVFRLDLVKEELKNFVKNHIGKDKNQMALIKFGSTAFPYSYFTFDISPLLFLIDQLNPKDFPPEGTDIGLAIKTGLEMFDTIDSKPEVFKRPKYKRVFVLISDGEEAIPEEEGKESPGSTLSQAISEVRKRGIPIYTIGVGSLEGDDIVEEINENGEPVYMVDDETGEKIHSRLEEGVLKKIAQSTGGKYTRSQTGEELSMALEDIVEREAEKETKTEKDYHDIWQYLFGAAFVLCLIIIILHKI